MSKPQSTSRTEKAQALIATGAVTLLPGTGTAIVRGSGKAEYIVSKTADGVTCQCPDFAKRGIACKHIGAVKQLCETYHRCSREARQTGRTRLPADLARALRGRAAFWPKPVTIQPVVDQDDLFPGQAPYRAVA